MTDNRRWMSTVRGAHAAELVRSYIDELTAQLRRGDVERVRQQLLGNWSGVIDTSDIPLEVIQALQARFNRAWRGLAQFVPQTSECEEALAEARRIVGP